MKLHALPLHFNVHKGFLPNHTINEVSHPALPYKPKRNFWHPKHHLALTPAIFGYSHIQIYLKSKENILIPLKVCSKLKRDHGPDSSSRSTYDNNLDDGSHTSRKIRTSEDSYIESNEPSSEESTTCQLFPTRELSQESIKHQAHLEKLRIVLLHVLAFEQCNASRLKICHRNYLVSATNLIHYLALQCLDVQLKEDLSSIGLLDLEQANSSVLANIIAAVQLLENFAPYSLKSKQYSLTMNMRDYATALESKKLTEFSINAMAKRISMHSTILLGPLQDKKGSNIMVTVGKEAISSKMLLHDLIKEGASVIRINCAHDNPSVWSEIIRLAKYFSQMLEKPCRILMDLAGPKLRTEILKTGPNVMKISPQKDAKGDVVFPAQIWLSYSECEPPAHISPNVVLFIEGGRFHNELEVGSVLKFVDLKGRRRSLQISQKFSVFNGCGYIGECHATAYVESGTRLYIRRKKDKVLIGKVVNVPAVEQFIRLRVGDLLAITRDPTLQMEDLESEAFGSQHRITCKFGHLFYSVKPGDPIAFDDGKIWGVIQGTNFNEIIVRITHASPKGSKLASEKSINIPNSDIQFEGLTSKDLMDLNFVAANADIVGISFIRNVHDLFIVLQELEKRKLQDMGVVLKIETRGAFENLPLLLLQAMQHSNPIGVMIARGDLAVECGWDQMATIQEDILSICSAAHVPVIWATQVLESLAKSGIPTRAELTDVASGMRANCIMLNKGNHIVQAVSTLNSILCNHSAKNVKTSLKPLLFSNI